MNVMNFRFFRKKRIPTPVVDDSDQIPEKTIQVLEESNKLIGEPPQVYDDYQIVKCELDEVFLPRKQS